MSQNAQQAGPDKIDRRPAIPDWAAPAAIATLGVLALLGLVFLSGKSHFEPTKAAPKIAQATVQKQAAPNGPTFDTVRVDAGGNAVIAGRAAPGATVTITANGKPIGTVKADSSGSFAFVTSKPLAPGGQQIAISEALGNGQTLASARSVTVSVPNAPNEGALAVLSGIGKTPSEVLTGQGPKPGSLGLGSVDYDATGNAVIAGTAKPGAHVSLFLGHTKLGTAIAGANGRWQMRTDHMQAKPGTFRLETTGSNGAVTATMQTAFAPHRVASLAPGHVVIKRGQCLWLIARAVYGKGTEYSLIYRANEASIRDPNLIYPGQRFVLPQPAQN
ncbi:LysM peptidoglycan-binding domain-containing protein [Acidiphilium sp. AL]|uniref:Ig-like domain-containing protein n=1 Tax=Acidiphilium iwatense TaxID=768198 RepID=A0ABS9DQX9_9PROT|nr:MULTISPECIES: Ig-like domain-containing protein [Acidiphilium]MCF3945069.1 Ig-like domain-containing protein [Acidiphilium iwatense]MCU4160585.1 LysM peptidoglycan-binding domain-containing protein [Acidiphilium sp. AL]